MGLKRTDEFRKDAVRIALTSGLTRTQGADDLGVGMSTLNEWISAHRDTDVVSKEDLSLAQENDRVIVAPPIPTDVTISSLSSSRQNHRRSTPRTSPRIAGPA